MKMMKREQGLIVGIAALMVCGAQARALPALPLSFERNAGQTDARVSYLARGRGYTLFLARAETVLRTASGVVRLEWRGADGNAAVVPEGGVVARSNYFVGRRERWRTGVERYGRVRYRGLYPGVDAVFYGRDGELEYDLVLAPGADLSKVRMRVEGADSIALDAAGNLRIALGTGAMTQRIPEVYQETGGKRSRVAARYAVEGNEVAFVVERYDRSRPLVVDPTLSYSSYLGGSASDAAAAIAVDSAGNAYITGLTLSADFPVVGGDSGGSAYSYAFVAKIAPSGNQLIYSSYIGGSGETQGRGIAVDSGYVYLTGMTRAADFPLQNAIKTTMTGAADAFVFKATLAGDAIAYSTYLGGSDDDQAKAIAIDSAGGAYVCGRTVSSDFPVPNGAQRVYGGNIGDVFAAKLTASGALAWGTYLGGSGDEDCTAIALDSSRNVYVAGATTSSNFPMAPYQNGGAFSAKFSPDGSQIVYALAYGPAFSKAYAIAADAAGNAYVAGRTPSHWLTTSGSFQPTYGGGNYDAFVMKVNAAGNALVYSTYLGGKGDDNAYALAIDAAGNAYVAGDTTSTDFPMTNSVQPSLNGGSDIFVTKVGPTGSALSYSTLLGGSGNDSAFGLALDAAGAVYIAGATTSMDYPTLGPIQGTLGGASDAVIARIDGLGSGSGTQCSYSISPSTYNAPAAGGSFTVSVSAPAGCSWFAGGAPSWASLSLVSGSGSGSLTVQVAANSGPARTGTATIAGATLTISQAAGSSSGGGAVGTLLVSGTPASFTFAAATASTIFHGDYSYRIDVPQSAAQLVIDLASSQAVNLSLYVRYGSDVVLSGGSVVADYSATGSGATKRITITPSSSPALQAGTYYIGVLVATTGVAVSGTVTATVTQPSSQGSNTLSPGSSIAWSLPAVTSPSLFHGQYAYRVDVGSSVTELEIFLSVATAGASVDLYVRYGTDVVVSNGSVVADYWAVGGGATKRIVIDRGSNPALRPGTYYVAFAVNTTGTATQGSVVANAGTASQPPVVSDGGVVGAASFVAAGVVPGSPFTIFGDGLAPAEAGATSVPLPTKLGGVQVRVNGILVPLFYAGPKQINAQLPYEIAPGDAEVEVLVNGMVSAATTFHVYAAGPGIIQYSAGGRLRAVAVNQDGAINGTSAAAARGSVVTVYLVGAGPVKPGQPLVTGAATPMELRWLDSTYSVTIGGVAAVVDYIGLTPGAVGLYQMNVHIPQSLAPGDYQVSLQVGSAQSNTPYLAVK